MAITDASQMSTLCTALGVADNKLLVELTYGGDSGTSAITKVREARNVVLDQAGNDDFDNATTLLTALRADEKELTTVIKPILHSSAVALEAYILAQTTQKFRTYFKSGITWTDEFRELWRRALGEEIIVRLSYITRAAGSWGAKQDDKTISLNSRLELRTGTSAAIGAAAIIVSVTAQKVNGTSQVFTVNVPGTTAAGTVFTIGETTDLFSSVSALTATGGTDGDKVEIWVA